MELSNPMFAGPAKVHKSLLFLTPELACFEDGACLLESRILVKDVGLF